MTKHFRGFDHLPPQLWAHDGINGGAPLTDREKELFATAYRLGIATMYGVVNDCIDASDDGNRAEFVDDGTLLANAMALTSQSLSEWELPVRIGVLRFEANPNGKAH